MYDKDSCFVLVISYLITNHFNKITVVTVIIVMIIMSIKVVILMGIINEMRTTTTDKQ